MLSLALIVRDEEKNLIRCLDSIQGLWDELVIVDTGSIDKTVEIAKQYTPNIYHFKWIDDFAKARNFAFSKCTQSWVMWIDADDFMQPNDIKIIREEMLKISQRSEIDYVLINYHYLVEPPTPQGTPMATQTRERIIRRSVAKWEGRIHEHIPVDFSRITEIKAAVWHLRDGEDFIKDSSRNIKILKKAIRDEPNARYYFYLGDEYSGQGKLKIAIDTYKISFNLQTNLNYKFQAAYKIGQKYKDLAALERAKTTEVISSKENRAARRRDERKTKQKYKNSEKSNLDEALDWFKKSLDYEVRYREPFLMLGEIYFQSQRYDKAAFWLDAACRIEEPDNPLICIIKNFYTYLPYDLLAQSYFHMGEYKKCIEASERLYELAPSKTYALDNIKLSRLKLREAYKRPSGTIKLNLGAGTKKEPGFISCDLFQKEGIEEVFSLDEITSVVLALSKAARSLYFCPILYAA